MAKFMPNYSIEKINIAQYTIFKHDVFGTGEGKIFKKIWKFVDDIGLSRVAKVHTHYENEIDIAEYHHEKLKRKLRSICNLSKNI